MCERNVRPSALYYVDFYSTYENCVQKYLVTVSGVLVGFRLREVGNGCVE